MLILILIVNPLSSFDGDRSVAWESCKAVCHYLTLVGGKNPEEPINYCQPRDLKPLVGSLACLKKYWQSHADKRAVRAIFIPSSQWCINWA